MLLGGINGTGETAFFRQSQAFCVGLRPGLCPTLCWVVTPPSLLDDFHPLLEWGPPACQWVSPTPFCWVEPRALFWMWPHPALGDPTHSC